MKILRNLVISTTEPSSDCIWAKPFEDTFMLYIFINGRWVEWVNNITVSSTNSSQETELKTSEEILESMSEDLRNSLLFWYQPKVFLADEGKSIEEFNTMLSEGYDVLKDLSGNELDITIHGFDGTEEGGYLNSDYDLYFDGVDNYCSGTIEQRTLEDFTLFSCFNTLEESPHFLMRVGKDGDHVVTRGLQSMYSLGKYQVIDYSEGANIIQKNRIISGDTESTIISGDSTVINDIFIMRYISSYDKQYKGTMKYAIMFDRSLSDDEIAWVNENMVNY